jgi:soluble lytic murein transglycosylase
MRRTALSLALLALLSLPLIARAQPADFTPVATAMAAGDWDLAYALAAPGGEVARDLVTWTRLRAGAGTFGEYAAFVAAHAHWPGLDRLRAEGEKAIVPGHPAAEVLAWFDGTTPQTGEGAVRLAEALYATGDAAAARESLETAWLTLGLTDEGQAAMLAAYPAELAPHHAARVDSMLWRWRTTDAARLLMLLDADTRALAEARIALITNAADQATKLAAVPPALAGSAALAYDRFNRLADSGDYTDATALLDERSVSADALGQPFRWASWRATLARWAMREGRPDQAYALATRHYLTEGEQFADLEWVAGYVALTYLDRPAAALAHFTTVEGASRSPISLARGGYWTARALDALGRTDEAQAAYARAAQHQTAFYGLLSAERLGLPQDPALAGTERFDWQGSPFLQTDLAQAMLLLLAAEERGTAVLFVAQLARTLDRSGIGQLGAMLADMDEPFLGVLTGKAAVDRGILVPAVYFPLHPMTALDLSVDMALALSIARRESEFNHTVGSPVGALGLMQLMPGTAEEVAGELGMPYSRARLTADWQYNAILGARYLANLEGMFGRSPVMVAAGYNAGPSRPRTWMTQRGDPRRGEVDVVDWIEHIPFTETRNYVMRVTESIPVYRARLSGAGGTVSFLALLRGEPPRIRPQARPDPATRIAAQDAAVAPVPAATPPAASTFSPTAPLRPQARPTR